MELADELGGNGGGGGNPEGPASPFDRISVDPGDGADALKKRTPGPQMQDPENPSKDLLPKPLKTSTTPAPPPPAPVVHVAPPVVAPKPVAKPPAYTSHVFTPKGE